MKKKQFIQTANATGFKTLTQGFVTVGAANLPPMA